MSSLRLLAQQSESLTDLLVKLGEVIEVLLYFLDVQIDKHASDLGGSVGTNELLDVVEDEVADHGLVVGVFGSNGGKQSETSLVVGADHGVLMKKGSLRATSDTGSGNHNLRRSGDLLLRDNWLTNGLLHHRLLSGCTTVSTVVEVASLAANSLRAARIWTIVAHRASVVVKLRNTAIEALLEEHENILDEVEGFGSLQEGGIDIGRGCLLAEVHEVGLVLHLGLLSAANLGQLIVCNEELLLTDGLTVEASTSLSGAVGLLEAHEGTSGVASCLASLKNLDGLNFTELVE